MKAKFIYHENDGLTDKVAVDFPHLFRRGDVVVFGSAFYKIEAAQYDMDEEVATYWLEQGTNDGPCPVVDDEFELDL